MYDVRSRLDIVVKVVVTCLCTWIMLVVVVDSEVVYQVVLFVDDKTVSKGMVKYVSGIPKESIVDVSGEVHVPQEPVQGCTCSQV